MRIISTVVDGFFRLKLRGMRLLLLFGALLILPVVAFTSSASAYSCASGALCIWKDANGMGATTSWGGTWHNECWNFTPSWNDVMSSATNNMDITVTFWRDINCGSAYGDGFNVGPHTSVTAPNLPLNWTMNDRISSVWFW